MKLSWLCSLIVALGVCCCSASATEASLILVNAKLWTENPAQPTAQAVALDGSRILAVGNNAPIRKLAGPDTRIIDLGGRPLLPGFNDSHVHFLIGGGSLITVHLGAADCQAEFKDGAHFNAGGATRLSEAEAGIRISTVYLSPASAVLNIWHRSKVSLPFSFSRLLNGSRWPKSIFLELQPKSSNFLIAHEPAEEGLS